MWPVLDANLRRERMTLSKRTMDLFSTGLLRVMKSAKRDPEVRFRSLAHTIDGWALQRAYRGLRKGAAVGVDGIDKGVR